MKIMSKKSILTAGVAAAAVGLLGAYAVAQTGPGGGHGRMGGEHGMMQGKAGVAWAVAWAGWPEPWQRHGHRRRRRSPPGAAKTEIGITAAQSPAWDTYTKVVTTFAAERREHREKIDHDAVQKMDQKERDAFRKTMQKQRDEAATKVRQRRTRCSPSSMPRRRTRRSARCPGWRGRPGWQGMRHGMAGGERHGQAQGQGRPGAIAERHADTKRAGGKPPARHVSTIAAAHATGVSA